MQDCRVILFANQISGADAVCNHRLDGRKSLLLLFTLGFLTGYFSDHQSRNGVQTQIGPPGQGIQ
jgi:hypothetical protein